MRYDSQVFYDVSGPLVQWQLSRTMAELDITPRCRLVDIGGGTGGFTHELAKRMAIEGSEPQVMLVEPAEEMIAQAKTRANPALKPLHGDVETFLATDEKCDRVMFKEVVHHIPTSERDRVFSGLYKRLPPGGRVLIITRPSILGDHPFPDFFLKYWAENQPTPESYEEHLRQAGFEVVSRPPEGFPLCITKEVWYRMLRDKFWSWLAQFSDEKIEEGIAELEKRYPDTEEFNFEEKLNFIVGTK